MGEREILRYFPNNYSVFTIPKYGVLLSLQERVTAEPWCASMRVLLGLRKEGGVSLPSRPLSTSVNSELRTPNFPDNIRYYILRTLWLCWDF